MIISTTPGFLKQDFIKNQYLVRDTSLLSPSYFDITHFPESIGGGVSLIKLRGNETNLATNKLTQVEILDVQGTPVRHEVATYIDRFQNYYVSIYVYDTTAPGVGSVSFVGVAKRDLQGNPIDPNVVNDSGHNVIWTRPITILPFARNNSELVFDDPPQVSVAQVITSARVSYNNNIDTRYSAVTSSGLSITTSNFKGFDVKRASNFILKNGKIKNANKDKITDKRSKQVNININNQAVTTNNTEVPTRTANADIVGGFMLNETNRYNTILIASESFFSSSYIGAKMEFFTSSYTLSPSIPTGYDLSNTNPYDALETALPITQSLREQLARWTANIVKIKDNKTAYIDQPVQVDLRRTNAGVRTLATETKHTFYNTTAFTASIYYTPDSLLYVTSSEVSQSYLQFTIQNLNPIGGQVEKVRVYYRRGSEVGDWSLLNDQLIEPVEFLTDARYPNQTNYGLDISDYYLLGHFTDQSVVDANWSAFVERATTFDTTSSLQDNSVLLNSAKLVCSASISNILTTRYYQNYAEQVVYSLSFNCIVDPYTQIQLYENSFPLATTVFGSDPFPRAFDKTINYEPTSYADRFNRYGKLIGKITNNTGIRKDYGRVVFDFKTDQEGLGRPMFRTIRLGTQQIASAYVSEISVTPRQLNGYTPSTVQFAFPAKLDTNIDLNESIDYKLEYYDYTGNQSEYVTYLEDNVMELQTEIPTTACQTETAAFRFRPAKYFTSQTDSKLGAEASQSAYLNVPIEGSMSFAAGGEFTNPIAFSQLGNDRNGNQIHLWPDWDEKIPYGITSPANIFVEQFAKIYNYYAIHQPNFVFSDTSSFTIGQLSTWNVLRPSMSVIGADPSAANTSYVPNWPITASYPPLNINYYVPDFGYGSITSSWQYIDLFTRNFVPGVFGNPTPPAGTTAYKNVYRYTYGTGSRNTSIDGRLFYDEGGLGISQLNVSNSYYSYSIAPNNDRKTEALKKRRLYWPTAGYQTASYFTENGGIYNVKFKLKKYGSNDFNPDNGSFMRVYIFDVKSSFTTETEGTPGWYPPSQNIVKIGNNYTAGGLTVPAISFYDSSTGYSYDEYNINLVQYGTTAQLVFEACGEGDNWFGIIVDDVEFCKIGTTTDPHFIKPASIASGKITSKFPEAVPNIK